MLRTKDAIFSSQVGEKIEGTNKGKNFILSPSGPSDSIDHN